MWLFQNQNCELNLTQSDSWAEIFYPNCILITNSYVCFYKSDCEKDDYLHNVTGLIICLQKLYENKYKIDFYTGDRFLLFRFLFL